LESMRRLARALVRWLLRRAPGRYRCGRCGAWGDRRVHYWCPLCGGRMVG